jgi:hypothetical protein
MPSEQGRIAMLRREGKAVLTAEASRIALPGRPVAGTEAGPEPHSDDPRQARVAVRAICCSGGGIRAAAFSLGGIQALNESPQGDGRTFYESTDLMTSVSGGGYIAGSTAIVAHNLSADTGPEAPSVYAPGSPEDSYLRTHTKYLIDSKTQLVISMMGIGFGLFMNLAAIGSAAFVVATLLGFALGGRGLSVLTLSPDRSQWELQYPPALIAALVGLASAGALVYVVYRVWDTYRPFGDVGTKRWCVPAIALLAAALLGSALFVGVPWLVAEIGHNHGTVPRVGLGGQGATFVGMVTALVGIVTPLVRSYTPRVDGRNPVVSTVATKTAPLRHRVVSAVLPWLGSALIVVALGIAMLAWVATMAGGLHDRRMWTLAIAFTVLLLAWQVLTDSNRTSVHRYYTQRLATAFARSRDGQPIDPPDQSFSRYTKRPSQPELVVCAAANTDMAGIVPSGRRCAPFTFSPYYAGLSTGTMFRGDPGEERFTLAARERDSADQRTWNAKYRAASARRDVALMMPTSDFEAHSNGLTLIDMMAVSGAAVSPAMGRLSRPSIRLLLGVADVRLGMWLPNPLRHHRLRYAPTVGRNVTQRMLHRFWWQLRQPGLGALAREICGGLDFQGNWIYVTDGGHYENLGLTEALRRGATEIVVFDATGDTPFSLATFGQAVETARADLGVEIALVDRDRLGPGATKGRAKALAAVATATYANGVVATIYLCKAAVVNDLPADVLAWAHGHASFPNDTTANQFYGDREFEAYRRLGYAAAQEAVALMTPEPTTPTAPVRRQEHATASWYRSSGGARIREPAQRG